MDKRNYRMVTVIAAVNDDNEITELLSVDPNDERVLAYFGTTVSAPSFTAAFVDLTKNLNDRLLVLSSMTDLIEESHQNALSDEKTVG